ncbi:MAG: 2'-5' RNA ligase [Desulfobacterales bacterium RIFOXYA12_FULL_46_15]|nr:MAG: 2'-5' RNA ligase [Desulfobacterales bacterium RIFOXYA12_FULL_46_15]
MKEDPGHTRSFIAIQIPDTVKALFLDLQGKLKKSGIHASFPSPETLHLTLKFLGHISPGDIGTIEKSMEKAVTGILPHTLFASGIGVFPSVKHARIIWSGIQGETGNLEKLASKLDFILLKAIGVKKEEKRFRPHLTLARVKKEVAPESVIKMIKTFENFQTPGFSVSGISLFQSELSSSGAVHKQISFIHFLH